MLAVRAALFFLPLFLAYALGQSQNSPQGTKAPIKEQQVQKASEQPKGPVAASVAEKTAPKGGDATADSVQPVGSCKTECGNSQPDKEWWYKFRTDPVATFTGLLFLATVALWWSTKQLVRGSEDTATHQLRAYAAINSISFHVNHIKLSHSSLMGRAEFDEVTNNLELCPKNFGATPAFEVSIYCTANAHEPDDLLLADALPIVGRQMLHPGMTYTCKLQGTQHNSTFFMWGHVVYRDIYRRWWRTNFYYRHIPENLFTPERRHNEEKGPYATEAEALQNA